MDKFATLEPIRLYSNPAVPSPPPSNRFSLHRQSTIPPSSHSRTKSYAPFQLIGRLPVDLHIHILTYLAVPDIPAYARASRALANLAKDERVWEARWKAFGVEKHKLVDVLDNRFGRYYADVGTKDVSARMVVAGTTGQQRAANGGK